MRAIIQEQFGGFVAVIDLFFCRIDLFGSGGFVRPILQYGDKFVVLARAAARFSGLAGAFMILSVMIAKDESLGIARCVRSIPRRTSGPRGL